MCAETAAGAGVAVGSAVGAGVAVGVAVGATAVTVVTEGVDVGVVSGVGVGVLSCPPSLPLSPLSVLPPVLPLSPLSPPVVPPLPESSVLGGTWSVTTAVRVMVKGFSLSFFASAANSSALRVLKSSVPLYSLSLCVQALTL